MTKDLAILIGPDEPFLSTEQFLDELDRELRRRMSQPATV
jgi:isocitrate dehydrogenase